MNDSGLVQSGLRDEREPRHPDDEAAVEALRWSLLQSAGGLARNVTHYGAVTKNGWDYEQRACLAMALALLL